MNTASSKNLTTLQVLRKTIPSDLETPVSAFRKLRALFPDQPAFLFESVEQGEHVGRYSILGFNGEELVKWKVESGGNPLQLLAQTQKEFSNRFSSPPSFPMGSFGYLSFDAVRAFETLPETSNKSSYPDAYFVMPKRMVLFDHVRNTMTLFAITEDKNDAAINQLENALVRGNENEPPKVQMPQPFTSTETRESYKQKVNKAKEYIKAGDIYQVVLSQQITGRTKAKPLDIYRALRMLNPSPYMFYIDFNQFQLIGSSPEMLVKVENGVAETRPIAGTRWRGKTIEEDLALSKELLKDPKELAEHTMLVDLGRNDLGRVCDYGSVKVSQLMGIERYSHVMHIVSIVTGHVRSDKISFDVLQSAFPAGTVSGAPKIRAMEIIQELEGVSRGTYAGCVGYVSFSGDLDTCITIRTLLMENEKVILQAGGGIVCDSDPDREYEESLNKCEALKQAILLAEAGFNVSWGNE